MRNFWVLSGINLYNILCPHKLNDYKKRLARLYGKDDVIYFEDNQDENIYLVSSGKVKLVNYDSEGKEIVRQILTKGEMFGEHLILGSGKREELAIAMEANTSLCGMNVETMKELMRSNENFSNAIYRFIGWRFQKFQRRLDLLVGKDVTSRIACYLYDLYTEQSDGGTISHPLSQKDIGALLATSRESVAKIFKKFKDDGIVDYDRKHISILKIEQLKALSGD